MPKSNTNTLVITVLAALLAYPLSTGPVIRLEQSGYLPLKYLPPIYAPLSPCMNIPVFRSCMLAYLRLWGVDVDPK